MRFRRLLWLVALFGLLLVAVAAAQYRRGGGRREIDPNNVDRNGVPEWKNDERFKNDVFTFVRIRYSSYGRGGWGVLTDIDSIRRLRPPLMLLGMGTGSSFGKRIRRYLHPAIDEILLLHEKAWDSLDLPLPQGLGFEL